METQSPQTRRPRQEELDFLKCLFILLMISFHLVYIGDSYPYAKQVVYTFHMPGFLLISGYLMNIDRTARRFARTLMWLAIPYAVMESGYTVMASLLPIREHIEQLTPAVFLDKLLVHPLGPYWYLHTMLICGAAYFATFRYVRLSTLSRFILLGLLYALLAKGLGLLSMAHALYFLAGAVVRRSGLRFTDVFQPSLLAVPAFALLACWPANLGADTAGGVLMVWMAVSIGLLLFQLSGGRWRLTALFIGRNTMALFLFSPIFTILCKPLVPLLQFDPTGLLFLLVSLAVCTTGSLSIGWAMDRLGWSRLMVGHGFIQ